MLSVFPDLCRGTILAILQLVGNIPNRKGLSVIKHKAGANVSEATRKKYGDMLS